MSPGFFQRWALPLALFLFALINLITVGKSQPAWFVALLAVSGVFVVGVISLAFRRRGTGDEEA